MDHNILEHKTFNNAFIVKHGGWGGSAFGDGSWAEDVSLGTERAIYIEDNIISSDFSPPVSVNDCLDGGRFVFRHNQVTNDYVQGWRRRQYGEGHARRVDRHRARPEAAPSIR